MDQNSLKRFLLNAVLLMSANVICLHGDPATGLPSLHCVNDYLYTVNCTLSKAPSTIKWSSNGSYWLTFRETYGEKEFRCFLRNEHKHYFCTVDKSAEIPEDDYKEVFMDLDSYKISLCHNQSDGHDVCQVLKDNYKPCTNIKPNAPCCLTVNRSSTRYNFTWESTYENYEYYTFRYHLQIIKIGRGHRDDKVTSHNINTDSKHFSVDGEIFVSVTEYTARVRSSPNIPICKGEWSDWSPVVHWKTDSVTTDLLFMSELLQKSLVPFVVLVFILIVVCVAFRKKRVFIPTPAPYFHMLYSDCHGDFKSWVTTAAMQTVGTSAQIDSQLPHGDRQPQFDHQVPDDRAYYNIPVLSCDSSPQGLPGTVSVVPALSATETLRLSSEPGSPTQGDSSGWLCSDRSLEKGSPWYCNEYCTLSAFTADQRRATSTNSF